METLTLESWSDVLRRIHRETKSWQVTGQYFHLNKATARLIAKGYRPGVKVSRLLGVQVYLPAPACAKCGRVHTTARCTEGKQPRRRWVRCAGHAGGHYE